jgi:L-xylulokinase
VVNKPEQTSGYLLGIDSGNTVIKAAVFDLQGRELAVCNAKMQTAHPQCGFAETDMQAHWLHCVDAVRSALAQSGVQASDVLAVGCSGHGNGLYLLDTQCEPLLAIQSMDARAESLVTDGSLDVAAIQAINGQGIWAAQTPMLLRWLKLNRPELYQRIGAAFLCKDYIGFRLTGECASDRTDMSGCGLIDFVRRDYSADLHALYGIPEAGDYLPSLFESTDVIGGVTDDVAAQLGLSSGTPVVAGLFDVVASALGSGVERTGQASIIAGTWSINQVVVEALPEAGSIFMASCFDRRRFLAIESSATSATNLEWFVHEFCQPERAGADQRGVSVFAVCNERLSSVEPSLDLPIFHPYLYGSGQSSLGRAGFFGVTGWHDRQTLLYAIYEGVVFGHRHHIERLRTAGIDFDSAILTGGGARSDYWAQMFADVLNVEIHLSACSETGARGAAIAAGVGAGTFPDYAAGVAAMTTITRTFKPDQQYQSIYERRYQLFCRLLAAMEPLWDSFSHDTP